MGKPKWPVTPLKHEGITWGYGDLDAVLSMYDRLWNSASDEQHAAFQATLLNTCLEAARNTRVRFEYEFIAQVIQVVELRKQGLPINGSINAMRAADIGAVPNRNKPNDFQFISDWLMAVMSEVAYPAYGRSQAPLEAIVQCLGVPAHKIRQLVVMLLG